MSRDRVARRSREPALGVPIVENQTTTSFEAFREYTSWKRPGRDHGCKPVEIVPGLWTAHYHDIDSLEKLRSATNNAPIQLVVNSALCQCDARDGFYGKGVKVMEIALEDDPDPRKYFDQGKPCTANCTDPNVPLVNRFPGEAIKDFDAVSKAVEATIASGGHALIHCHASLSRSVAFILAHLMRTRGLSLLGAAQVMKPKWDAVWPCDRFVDQLRTYEQQLSTPYRFTTKGLVALCVGNMLAGAVVVYALKK